MESSIDVENTHLSNSETWMINSLINSSYKDQRYGFLHEAEDKTTMLQSGTEDDGSIETDEVARATSEVKGWIKDMLCY